jgi:hypothetical protein
VNRASLIYFRVLNFFPFLLFSYIKNRDWTTPKISQDQIISSKKKRISHANYKVNYNLLFDGKHPRRAIARLCCLS